MNKYTIEQSVQIIKIFLKKLICTKNVSLCEFYDRNIRHVINTIRHLVEKFESNQFYQIKNSLLFINYFLKPFMLVNIL